MYAFDRENLRSSFTHVSPITRFQSVKKKNANRQSIVKHWDRIVKWMATNARHEVELMLHADLQITRSWPTWKNCLTIRWKVHTPLSLAQKTDLKSKIIDQSAAQKRQTLFPSLSLPLLIPKTERKTRACSSHKNLFSMSKTFFS